MSLSKTETRTINEIEKAVQNDMPVEHLKSNRKNRKSKQQINQETLMGDIIMPPHLKRQRKPTKHILMGDYVTPPAGWRKQARLKKTESPSQETSIDPSKIFKLVDKTCKAQEK